MTEVCTPAEPRPTGESYRMWGGPYHNRYSPVLNLSVGQVYSVPGPKPSRFPVQPAPKGEAQPLAVHRTAPVENYRLIELPREPGSGYRGKWLLHDSMSVNDMLEAIITERENKGKRK